MSDLAKQKRILLLQGGPGMTTDYLIPLICALSDQYIVQSYNQSRREKNTIETLLDELKSVYVDDDIPTIILGHSFGGVLAATFATTHAPENLVGLILLCSPLHKSWTEDFESASGEKEEYKKAMSAISELDVQASADDRYKASTLAWSDFYFTPKEKERGIELLNQTRFDASIFEAINANYMNTLDVTSNINSLALPVYVIWAAQDHVVNSIHAKKMQSACPNAIHLTVEDCGHFPFILTDSDFMKQLNTVLSAIFSRINESTGH